MIKDEIKKANLVAMKNKDQVARGLYSVVLNKIMMEEVKRRTTGKEMTDGDVLAILQKTAKELHYSPNALAQAMVSNKHVPSFSFQMRREPSKERSSIRSK